jgi:hypothetical protein
LSLVAAAAVVLADADAVDDFVAEVVVGEAFVGFSGCCLTTFESKKSAASIHEFSNWLKIATGEFSLPPAMTDTLNP